MLEYYKLYLPKSKREVKIEVSVPRVRKDIVFDTLYFLDGQNAFKDSHASFGKSIGGTKALHFAAKNMKKRILGVAIYNSGSDLGRINEYSPFKIQNPAATNWQEHDVQNCFSFCEDLIHTIIPFVEKKYACHKSSKHRFIYGSSLAAITAIYLGLNYSAFSTIGAFSAASFLFEGDVISFIKAKASRDKSIFLYVGENEFSDEIYKSSDYINSAKFIYNTIKDLGIRTRLVIDSKGQHNEATWEKHLIDYINFIYYEDIIYT